MTETRIPLQRRSRKTQERILTAVSGLLRDKQFDRVSMSEIAGRAGVSVGGLYSRFKSKEALLQCFHEQVVGAQRDRLVAEFSPERWFGAGIEPIIRRYVEVTIQLFRGNCVLLREIALRSRAGDLRIRSQAQSLNETVEGVVIERLLERAEEIRASNPKLAVRIGLLAVSAALREVLLFGDRPSGEVVLDDARLANEMVHLFLGYLQRVSTAGECE